MYLFETNGASRISGHVIVGRVLTSSPSNLWEAVGTRATPRRRYFRYFDSRSTAYAFEIVRAVEYEKPVLLEEIRELESEFRVPQNFAYLSTYAGLRNVLHERSFEECSSNLPGGFSLKTIAAEQEQPFLELVTENISERYMDTGPQYGKYLIAHGRGEEDPAGIFTESKRVCALYHATTLVGFVVLTCKIAGTIKTGPTILLEEHRNLGTGTSMRSALHEFARRLGYRKIYCTVPSNHQVGARYLLSAGYRLEAHLRRQYHPDHDEFVFGFPLNEQGRPPDIQRVPEREVDSVRRIRSSWTEATRFLEESAQAIGLPVGREWAERQIQISAAHAKGRNYSGKPRFMFVGETSGRPVVAAICVPKRGGSCKMLLFTATKDTNGLHQVIERVTAFLRSQRSFPVRKVYSHVPTFQNELVNALWASGFSAEGVLSQAVSDRYDLLVVSKSI